MWSNIIVYLSRNPIALKALADLIAPLMRNVVKQETDPEIARLRQEMDALNLVVGKELPGILNALHVRHNQTTAEMVELRQHVSELIRRQEERELALRQELDRTRQELVELRRSTGQRALPEGETRLRRWFPW
ncbi:MAG: hypothetical protein M1401_18125 [Chloroflexi bacterium]|nr:hypothetical protein [Chloroflexota bacterium]